jgi:hypothetical protein
VIDFTVSELSSRVCVSVNCSKVVFLYHYRLWAHGSVPCKACLSSCVAVLFFLILLFQSIVPIVIV